MSIPLCGILFSPDKSVREPGNKSDEDCYDEDRYLHSANIAQIGDADPQVV